MEERSFNPQEDSVNTVKAVNFVIKAKALFNYIDSKLSLINNLIIKFIFSDFKKVMLILPYPDRKQSAHT